MATTNIGPCNCCGPLGGDLCETCDGLLPATMYITFTGGACDCFSPGSPIPLFQTSALNWDSCTSLAACDDCPGYPGDSLFRGHMIRLICVDTTSPFTRSGTVQVVWHDGTTLWSLLGDLDIISCDPLHLNVGPFAGDATGSGGPCNPGGAPTSAVVTE